MSKLIRAVLYKFGFVHHDYIIGGVLGGPTEIGAAVEGYMVWPALFDGEDEIHVEFTGTVVDPNAADEETPTEHPTLAALAALPKDSIVRSVATGHVFRKMDGEYFTQLADNDGDCGGLTYAEYFAPAQVLYRGGSS